jgi:hypothetical protein
MAVDVYVSREKETDGLCRMLCHYLITDTSRHATWQPQEQERQNPFVYIKLTPLSHFSTSTN